MAVNKVIYDGEPLIDLTADTVTADTLMEGATAHNAAGSAITGLAKRITVDGALSATSTNPVQNKVISRELDNLQTTVDSRSWISRLLNPTGQGTITNFNSGRGLEPGVWVVWNASGTAANGPYASAVGGTCMVTVVYKSDGTAQMTQQLYLDGSGDVYYRLIYEGTPKSWKQLSGPIVVATGTANGWTYRKYSDGWAECWANKTYTGTTSYSWGSLYVLVCDTPDYPFAFTSSPVVTQAVTNASSGSTSVWIASWTKAGVTNMGQIGLVRPTSSSGINAAVSFHAIGKWK